MAAGKKTDKKHRHIPRRYIRQLKRHIAEDRKVFMLYTVLRFLVLLTAIRCFFTRRYESFGACLLSLALFLMPPLAEDVFKIRIPPIFEAIIYIFIFAAEILGEVNNYYELIPIWDTLLHTTNGFLCGAVGFSLVYLLNRNSRNVRLSPVYMALAAFCFSMTIGVLWEFLEFIPERLLVAHDTQRDTLITGFISFYLDGAKTGVPVFVQNIARTVVETADGRTIIIEGGYLDIGLVDTIKDLFVNFLGAVVFSIFGYTYMKTSKHEKLVSGLLLQPFDGENGENSEFGMRNSGYGQAVRGEREMRNS